MTLEELSTKRDEVYVRIEKLRIEREELDKEIHNLFEESHQLHVQGEESRMPSNSDPLTPEKTLFVLTYAAIFFPLFVGIPCLVIRWVSGSLPPQWSVVLLVIGVSFFLWTPSCRWMGALWRPWRKFHIWAFKKEPSAQQKGAK